MRPESAYTLPLVDFVKLELALDEDEEIAPDTALLDLGLIDSMAIVALLAFVEETFGLYIAESAVNPRHLRDVHSIAAWLESLRPTLPA